MKSLVGFGCALGFMLSGVNVADLSPAIKFRLSLVFVPFYLNVSMLMRIFYVGFVKEFIKRRSQAR